MEFIADLILYVFAFLLVLVPLVIIHEFGHLIAAKSVGITVLEFGVGIPPRALKLFSRGGTEYTLNWVPLGGFVRPYGEDFMSPKDTEGLSDDLQEIEDRGIENPKSVFEAGPLERIWFFAAGAIFNIVTAFLLLFIMALLGVPEIVDGNVKVLNINGSVEELAIGDIVTHVDGEKVISAEEFEDAARGKSEMVLTVDPEDGEAREVLYTPVGEAEENTRVMIVAVLEDRPADEAGLEAGDIILRVQDEAGQFSVYRNDDLIDFTKEHEDQPMLVTVYRDGEIIETEVTPKDNGGVPQIGVQIGEVETASTGGISVISNDSEIDYVPVKSLGEATDYAIDRFNFITSETFALPGRVIRGLIPAEQARPVSPVAIAQVGGETLRQSQEERHPFAILGFAAIISFALALTNLLPIPALDGGRILFVLIEVLRGKPLSPEREGFIHLVGFMFLFALIIVFAVWDIVDPVITFE